MEEQRISPCTCGTPGYPVIDLTLAIILFRTTLESLQSTHLHCFNQDDLLNLRHDLHEACSKYGCFHVKLRHSCPACSLPLDCSGPLVNYNQVIQNIRLLCDDAFIRDLGISEPVAHVSFHHPTSISLKACFRGRGTESGSLSYSAVVKQTEPKQSWELHRCSSTQTVTPNNLCRKDNSSSEHRLGILQEYTHFLHSVAACIVSPLGLNLPSNSFLEERPCSCSICPSSNKIHPFCCMDLLRVFKYDAVASGQEQRANPGSNPHTDWGSLTVIWQDHQGGLENYCYAHQSWNPVETVDEPQSTFLFVHVGDFTSLVMNHNHGKANSLTWPSPRHQVLCPRLVETSSAPRYSLVYFVYPPMGVSLQDAVEKVHSQSTHETHDDIHTKDIFPYERYFILLDQSSSWSNVNTPSQNHQFLSERVKAKKRWETIRNVPFHTVIQEKWNQVQRG